LRRKILPQNLINIQSNLVRLIAVIYLFTCYCNEVTAWFSAQTKRWPSPPVV
jgi:hypothetical protein